MRTETLHRSEPPTTASDAIKDQRLAAARLLATGLLLVVGLGYVAATAFGPAHPAFKWVAVVCEAAMVGALADWFAVVALFRHPLGLPLPHTAILPRNKRRIAAGISEFIQDNFLSAQAIVAKIAEIGPADKLREWLLKKENARTVASYATRLLSFALSAFDDARVRTFLQGLVASKLREVDFAAGAGQLLDLVTKDKRHHAVFDEALRLLAEALAREETRATIAKAVVAESRLVDFVKKVGFDLDEAIARKIVSGAAKLVEEVRNDEAHALRGQFDAFIAGYIERLKSDPGTRQKVRELLEELIRNPALLGYVDALWREFRDWLGRDLADADSRVHGALADLVSGFGERIDANPALRSWIDEQILRSVPPLIDEHKAKIGRFIEDRINDWHDARFVKEMEREIGPDLQYIRINGTLVGGLAGLLIYLLTQVAT
jgi:uncharacterized membrane-anchored protein YjiN (DUF445 family)